MNVLIVEDDLLIADLLQEQLEFDGYSVCGVARTVKEARDVVARNEPDFAIVDIHLAHGDLGTDVATHLRETTSAGIIFSTGDSADLALLEPLGDAVMTKPYRLGDLNRGLQIIDEMARIGWTKIAFPASFQLLGSISDRIDLGVQVLQESE